MGTNSILFRRLFNFIPDIGVQLAAASYIRPFNIGNDWARIRLGALLAMPAGWLTAVTDITCRMGLSSSRAQGVASYHDSTQFIGCQLFPTGSSTYQANSGYPSQSANVNLVRIVGRTTNTTISGATPHGIAIANTSTSRMRRTPVILDITRPQGGGGNYTLTCYGMTVANSQVDYRPDHLMQAIDNWGTPTINGVAMTSLVTSSSIPASETFGEFDQFDLYWSRQRLALEVYALGATVLLGGYYSDAFGGAIETFESESLITDPARGSISYAGTDVAKGELYGGTFYSGTASWEGNGTLIGPSMGTGVYGYFGTTTNWPLEWFNQYQTGTYPSLSFNLGKGWFSDGTIIAP